MANMWVTNQPTVAGVVCRRDAHLVITEKFALFTNGWSDGAGLSEGSTLLGACADSRRQITIKYFCSHTPTIQAKHIQTLSVLRNLVLRARTGEGAKAHASPTHEGALPGDDIHDGATLQVKEMK